MATVYMVTMLVLLAAAMGSFFVGLFSLFQLFGEGRRAGYSFSYLYWFGVYKFAFTEKKGSPETRRMVIGFVGAVVGFISTGVVGALLEAARRG